MKTYLLTKLFINLSCIYVKKKEDKITIIATVKIELRTSRLQFEILYYCAEIVSLNYSSLLMIL